MEKTLKFRILHSSFFLFLLAGCMTMDMREVMKVQEDHHLRIKFLEEWVGGINEEIKNLQLLIQAGENQDYITNVVQTDQGITINFMQRSPITIRNGEEGNKGESGDKGQDGTDGTDGTNGTNGQDAANAPVMGVKKENGRYYWTITTDAGITFVPDSQGRKIPVSGTKGETGGNGQPGTDGQPGMTPTLAINTAGNWTVNGTEVLVNGRPLPAKGPDGGKGPDGQPGHGGNGAESSTYFQAVDATAPDYVVFTLKDGSAFTLPKRQEITFALTDPRPVLRFRREQSETLAYTGKGIHRLIVIPPEGWTASTDTLLQKITITAPANGNLYAAKDGNLSITARNGQGQQLVASRNLHLIRTSYLIPLGNCNSPVTDVYLVKTPEGLPIAEICYEYVKGYTETARKRSLVVYPWDPREEEYTAGQVIENGGRVNHDGTGYLPGVSSPTASVSIDIEGKFAEASETIATLSPTRDLITDFDNNTYGIVKIGQQYWMKENFRNTTLRKADGTTTSLKAPEAYDAYEPGSETTYSWLYDYTKAYESPLEQGSVFLPDGWCIPNSKELKELTLFIPDSRDLCAISGAWNTHPGQANTDLAGFGALPGGYINRNYAGEPHEGLHTAGEWWSCSVQSGVTNVVLKINHNTEEYTFHTPHNYSEQRSIRCIRDNRTK